MHMHYTRDPVALGSHVCLARPPDDLTVEGVPHRPGHNAQGKTGGLTGVSQPLEQEGQASGQGVRRY